MSKESTDDEISNKSDHPLNSKTIEMEAAGESSLLNSIVEAVMRGDMNQVVTLALSHRSSDQKVKTMVDQALSSAISSKAKLNEKTEDQDITDNGEMLSNNTIKSVEELMLSEPVAKSPNTIKQCNQSYSQRNQIKSNENKDVPCTYYFSNDSIISSNCSNINPNGNTALYCQSDYSTQNADIENHPDDSLNNTLSQYQITNSTLQNVESINTLGMSQQSVQVQLPGIGNFLLHIPSNFKPGEPITLPLNLPLTPVSQPSGVNPISIHMNTGQLMSNQLLSLYSPSSNINITAGKKMRAIAPKPSKPTYRQPLIAPKTSSPNTSVNNQDGLNSSTLPAPSGPGRRKGNKGKKSGRKRGAPAKSHKNSSYASSTHSMDSQDACQYNENNTLKQNCNNSLNTRSTYQCNYYVNNDSSDYLNPSHVAISHSFNEINSNTLLDNSDSGEKDLLSLAWEISNAELSNTDDFTTAYNLYDANNLGTDGFVSSEILDQFLQNIQKDDITELTRCSTTQINIDSRVSYASSFTTLPPCSTVLPSVTTSTYLNNYSNNSSNIELPQCIEIAEVVNLNTEDMLTELEKEENAFLDKFVAQYGGSHQNELIRCDPQSVIPVSLPTTIDCPTISKINDSMDSNYRSNLIIEDSEKEIDLNIKESNELSEIAKQIEISCSSSHQDSEAALKSKIYTMCESSDGQSKIDNFSKENDHISEANFNNNANNTISFCTIPNTSIELIYSSTNDSSLLDEKTQCLMSINFDSKRTNESSFYVTDSTLKSKTLDDFGLFEFCTDGEISLNMKTLNHESVNTIIDDDNKYIEPPILEDISDATPIQSENESEDEDIDELAFKFSRFTYFNSGRNKMKKLEFDLTEKLYFNDFIKNTPSLKIFQKYEFTQKQSENWYIGNDEIKILDIFSKVNLRCEEHVLNDNICCESKPIEDFHNLTKSSEEKCIDGSISSKNSEDIICNVKLNNTAEDDFNMLQVLEKSNIENNEKTVLSKNQTNIISTNINGDNIIGKQDTEEISKSLIEENVKDKTQKIITSVLQVDCNPTYKTQKYKTKSTVCSTLKRQKKEKKSEKLLHTPKKFKIDEIENMFDIPKDRQRRLRKPPKKLAIYQSINFIENKFSIAIDRKMNSKRKVEFSEKQKLSTDFRRCTRSKGTISKSFDSFYEAISRHKISSNSKSKISQKNISNKEMSLNTCSDELSEEKSNENYISNNEFISCTDIDQLSDLQYQIDNSNIVTNDDMDARLSNINIPPFPKTILKKFKSDYKNSNVIRKYNLRKNSISIKRESDNLMEQNSYLKIQKNKNNKLQNMSEINRKDTLKNNTKLNQFKRMRKFDKIKFVQHNINIAMLKNNVDEYENIDFHLAFFENKAIIIESVIDNLLYPTVNANVCQTANFVENKRYAYNHTSEFNSKKFYPVRKINRKLRIYSGLEASVKDDNIKYASLIDMSLNDFPCRFQCCSQFAKVIKPNNSVINYSMYNQFTPDSYSATIEIQNFNNSDEPISDTDDIESLDAPLVIVEIDEVSDHSSHIKSNVCNKNLIESNLNENKNVSDVVNQSIISDKPIVKKQSEVSDFKKTYSLRTKCRQNINFVKRKERIKRPLFNRLCKKSEIHQDINLEKDNDNDLINNINLKTPICSIEKLSHNDIIANLSVSPNSVSIDMLNNIEEIDSNLDSSFKNNLKTSPIDVINSINLKEIERNVFKKLKVSILRKIKTKVNVYKILKKSLWRKSIQKIFNNKLKSKSKIILNCYRNNSGKLDKNVKLLKDSITHLVIQSRDYNENLDNDDNESINVENDSPNNEFNTYLDANNVETFSRNYGSFSLKIKVQKKDPNLLEESTNIKKHKKNSKKRKKLRHFLSSIIGSDDITYKMNSSEDHEKITELNNEIKRKNRKRKYSLNRDTVCSDVYNTNQNLQNYLNQEISHLTPESLSNDDSHYQKPIKIKLFKSTNEDLSKLEGSSFHSEKIVFSLQKSDDNKSEFGKTANQKILQIIQNMPSKPCRQAANLAKKKIFSTAKEDRRSQNATLTSIWNSKRSNNGINKGTSDILTIYQNDRGKRPRGRPPKLGQALFTSEKQASSTGTLKLKIKLSKDFKNCNNDSHSSNGENSGRTSTNDSSILNSAVAGINGPSDALSLESNNFINGITEQLDQNIEYLEAKEAKVYFDPNQVDIEKIKNSFYSSKKINQESFSIELHQRLYENPVTNIPSNKSDNISNNRNFSQYGDMESVDSNNLYSNILSKENLSNSKLSHLSKDNMNISENCYSNLISNREPQNLSQNSQLFQFDNQLSSPERNSSDVWQNSKTNSTDSLTACRNNNNSWFSEHRNIRDQSFPNSNSIIYNSYMTSPVKESKNCIPQNPPFVCENENSDSKLIQRSPSKRSASSEGRKSVSNSFSINETHNQLSPHYIRSGIGSVPPQLNIHPWSDDTNHNTSLNHTAAAWVTYAQQQAAAAAYMDPQMKAYYNLALSQSMLNNPYCGSYGNPAANSENFYSSLHSQYLNNSKESSEKINISNSGVRNHNDPMGTFMEAAQMSSWEHFYSAAAMAGYHNSSQGAMDEYAGRAGNMLQAHHMLANGYPGSMLGRDHFSIENNKPPLAHQNQSGSTSPIKLTAAGSTPVSSSQAYSHVQMPYSHFSGTTVGFF